MRIRIHALQISAKQSTEIVDLDSDVVFVHGPVSRGKSTTARLIDYCLGGNLGWTPALRSEFLGAQLSTTVGKFQVDFERSATEGSPVRVTWDDGQGKKGAVNAPLSASEEPIIGSDVFNLSDLIFYLCGVQPAKVRKNRVDPDSPLVRLSFRDLMWYCFLQQDDLDSSFFQMHAPFKANKSRDVMRFVTGLYSDRLNALEMTLADFQQTQRTKREAVSQIRKFMSQFNLASEDEFVEQHQALQKQLDLAIEHRNKLDQDHRSSTHALEPIREQLRQLSKEADQLETAINDLDFRIHQQESLRSELITSKVKLSRASQAVNVLGRIEFQTCPRCGSSVENHRFADDEQCNLCGQITEPAKAEEALDTPDLSRDLNTRIDDLEESVERHKREWRRLLALRNMGALRKEDLDQQLMKEVDRYDSAYTSSARAADSKIAELQERLRSLGKFAQMPAAISELEREAAIIQVDIDRTRNELADEQNRLFGADKYIESIAESFKQTMLAVGFPGVYKDDRVKLDPRSWLPYVVHGDQEWSFVDAGSGGKKTLFNVCYALAVHRVALEHGLPLPSLLMIDSPTKNITRDEDPELVGALYERIYDLARDFAGTLQLILVDSHLVEPPTDQFGFKQRRMPPPLISYYTGP